VGALNNKQFSALCTALNHPEWSSNEKYKTNDARVQHRIELNHLLSTEIKGYTTDYLLTLLSRYEIPCSPVNNLHEVFENPQIKHLKQIETIEHSSIGSMKVTGSPVLFSNTPTSITLPPPLLGEHTEQILTELGYTTQQIEQMLDDGIVT
jgi:succinate--hydroxymethylglutarate CoA-transferase